VAAVAVAAEVPRLVGSGGGDTVLFFIAFLAEEEPSLTQLKGNVSISLQRCFTAHQ